MNLHWLTGNHCYHSVACKEGNSWYTAHRICCHCGRISCVECGAKRAEKSHGGYQP